MPLLEQYWCALPPLGRPAYCRLFIPGPHLPDRPIVDKSKDSEHLHSSAVVMNPLPGKGTRSPSCNQVLLIPALSSRLAASFGRMEPRRKMLPREAMPLIGDQLTWLQSCRRATISA